MRKRVISPKTGHDIKLGELVNFYGNGLALFYLLLITQADDKAIVVDSSPAQLKVSVFPAFDHITASDIAVWMTALHNHDFIYWDVDNEKVYFNPKRFYAYQSDVDHDRRRGDDDHPTRSGVLSMPKFATSAETWRKIEEVWALVPQKAQRQSTYLQIKEAIITYDSLSLYQVKMSMLSVIEKFEKKRDDFGTLFSNSLRWKIENNISDEDSPLVLTYDEWNRERYQMREVSKNQVEDRLKELDQQLQEAAFNERY